MRFLIVLFPIAALLAQAPVDPDPVVATIDGKKITASEFQRVLNAVPSAAGGDRKEFLRRYGVLLRLSKMAEEKKLDQVSPYKESLEFNRMQLLANAQMDHQLNSTLVTADEQKQFYEANKNRYRQVKLKVLYVSFNPSGAPGADNNKKRLTETEAKARIEKLRADLTEGADFVKLVREHSDDEDSKRRDGDFATVRQSDQLPDIIKSAVFVLKQGEISQPVRQPNGFYLFRAEEVSAQPYEQVRDEIFNQLRQARFKQWLDTTGTKLDIKVENETFFSTAPPAAPR
ncbi:MAG: peptidylprolyl isomerase [Bryobacteraceae bacterium]